MTKGAHKAYGALLIAKIAHETAHGRTGRACGGTRARDAVYECVAVDGGAHHRVLTVLIHVAHDGLRSLARRVKIAHEAVVAYFVAYRARVAAHAQHARQAIRRAATHLGRRH